MATYATNLTEGVNVSILDLNGFDLSFYRIDLENEKGIPERAHQFLELIKEFYGVILSLAEHNGANTVDLKIFSILFIK